MGFDHPCSAHLALWYSTKGASNWTCHHWRWWCTISPYSSSTYGQPHHHWRQWRCTTNGQMPIDLSSTTHSSGIPSHQYGNPRWPHSQFLPCHWTPQTSSQLLVGRSGTSGLDKRPRQRLKLFHRHHHQQRYRQHTWVLPTHQDHQILRHLDT